MDSRNFRMKELVKLRRLWLGGDHMIAQRVNVVHHTIKRRSHICVDQKPTKQQLTHKIKMEKQSATMKYIHELSECQNISEGPNVL